MASNDIGDWYRGIPQISKYWFTGSVVVPLIGRLGILSPLWFLLDFKSFVYQFQFDFVISRNFNDNGDYNLYLASFAQDAAAFVKRNGYAIYLYSSLPYKTEGRKVAVSALDEAFQQEDSNYVSYKPVVVPVNKNKNLLPSNSIDATTIVTHNDCFLPQIWRPITAALYYPISGPSGFHYLMNLYFLYSYSTRLETDTYTGSPADYAFMLLFNWICLVIIGFAAELRLLMDPLVLSVLYVWCQLNKDQIISFWFGTRFKAMYLPWVLFAFNLIIGSGGMMELFGIVVGHLYFFLMFKYPQDFGGAQLLTVPNILYRFFPKRQGGSGGFGQAPPTRRRLDDGGNEGGGWRNWGRGHQLGGD